MTELTVEQWPIERLIPYARNPRKNEEVVDKMAAAIQEFGFRIPIVARSDGIIVDGHLRLKAAQRLGLAIVPVALADELSDAQIKAFRLLANRSASWAEWDDELLKLEMIELQDLGFDLSQTGFTDEELTVFFEGEGTSEGNTDDDAVPEAPVEAITKLGDLWQLGEHRLLCADSTDLVNVKRLMDGETANMVFTDPPYNVDYAHCARNNITKEKNRRPIENDNLGKGFQAFLSDVCANILAVCDGGVYICMSTREIHNLYRAFIEAGGKWSDYVIWAKNHFVLGGADYHSQYEMMLYGWRKGADHFWCGARDQGNLWPIDRPSKNDLHPTMKPVELALRAIDNSSQSGETVLDLFGGSGTTLIACEKAGRRARLLEIDPKYCDVIVKRWEEFTGGKAILSVH